MAKRTPLYQNHLNHGGKVVEFGGFELPVQYGAGLIAEHNAVSVTWASFCLKEKALSTQFRGLCPTT